MKKSLLLTFACCLLLAFGAGNAQAQTLGEKFKGRILLQVESHGEAWYLDAVSGERFFLGRPADAFAVMRKLGLGVSSADFEKMKDKAPAKLSGRILLLVQGKGEAYYIDPVTLRPFYLGRPADAFAVMRSLGLGITNANLNAIQVSKASIVITVNPGHGTSTVQIGVPAGNTQTGAIQTGDNAAPETPAVVTPKIASIKLENGSDQGYIDAGDTITVAFSEAIKPNSINSDLEAGSNVNNVYFYSTGGVSVATNGTVTVRNIASFDTGVLEKNVDFPVKLALDANAKVLTITLLGGNESAIMQENLSDAKEFGGTIKDTDNNAMQAAAIATPSGSFGGVYNENSGTPYIASIKVNNNGSDGYIDQDDSVVITFNEAIDPKSISQDLTAGASVTNVSFSATGGISVSDTGKLLIKNIATFYVGSVKAAGNFTTRVNLSSTGKVLTITLTAGSDIAINSEKFSSTNQTGATIKDLEGRAMVTSIGIANPTGTFGGVLEADSNTPYVTGIEAKNGGSQGYIDASDQIVINFNKPVKPESINANLESGSYIDGVTSASTGGVSVSSAGLVTVKNIASFDMGAVKTSGNFTVRLALDSAADTLTITLKSGDPLTITSEALNSAQQFGGTIKDANDNAMLADTDISDPTGTFGGEYDDSTGDPYITGVRVTNNGNDDYIDAGDEIRITFSEAINPESISLDLDKGSYVSSIPYDATGGVSISSAGKVTIKNIAYFDMGSVETAGTFTVKAALDTTGKILTITLTGGSPVAITTESFSKLSALGGVITDADANEMNSATDLLTPSGSFAN